MFKRKLVRLGGRRGVRHTTEQHEDGEQLHAIAVQLGHTERPRGGAAIFGRG